MIGSSFLLLFRLAGGGFWAAMSLALAALTTRAAFYERPQIFDFLLTAWLLNALDYSPSPMMGEGKGGSGSKPPRSLWWRVPLVEALWANLHGGAALLGVGTVGLKAISVFLEKREAPGESPLSRPRLSEAAAWCGLAAAGLAAMLVNPHGWRLFPHLVQTLSFPGRELIQEWAPLPGLLNWHGFFFLLAALSLVLSWRRDAHLSLFALALGAMAARAVRHATLFVLAAAAFGARALQRLWPVEKDLRSTAWALVLIGGLSYVYGTRLSVYTAHLTGFGLKEYPEGAVTFLDRAGVEGRMFNEYGLGGYLIWKTFPRRKVFIDGRNVEYGPDLVRKAVGWYKPEVWKELDDEWKFDYAVIENHESYVAETLDANPDWALVFWDDASLVYLKREPRNEALIERYGYKFLQPNRITYSYLAGALADPRTAPKVLEEITRALGQSDQNVNAYQLRAYALGALGRREEAFRDLTTATARFPFKPGPFISLGWWYENAGELSKAASAYEKAAELARREKDPISAAFIYNNLGVVRFKLGDRAEAERLWKKCLELYPGHANAVENLRRLHAQ